MASSPPRLWAPLTVLIADRADRAVATALGVSTAAGRRLIAEGGARIAGRRVRKGEQLAAGALLEVARSTEPPVAAEPQLPLQLILETPALLVLDKPAGWSCFPLRPGERGTVANAVAARFPECLEAGSEPREAGLCHRLDRETSGALLVARRRSAFDDLRRQFRQRRVEKRYLALVRGQPADAGEIAVPLTSDRVAPRQASAFDRRPQPAVSRFWRRWSDGRFSLLEVEIETGVRFQIRAHLAALGTPLAGDRRYRGGPPLSPLAHQLLHARSLGFEDPLTGAPLWARAPLPVVAKAALLSLGLSEVELSDLDGPEPGREDGRPS